MPPQRHYVHQPNGACGCDHFDLDTGIKSSLFRYIDDAGVKCLNAGSEEDAIKVFKPYDRREDTEDVVTSDADETLIFHIPFNGSVTVKAIEVSGPDGDTHPDKMKAFINRDDIDFDNVEELEPTQEWDMIDQMCSYETRVAKFQGVYSLTLYFPSNYGAENTVISYIGLYGTGMMMRREPVIAVYEIMGNPADNKTKSDWQSSSGVGY